VLKEKERKKARKKIKAAISREMEAQRMKKHKHLKAK